MHTIVDTPLVEPSPSTCRFPCSQQEGSGRHHRHTQRPGLRQRCLPVRGGQRAREAAVQRQHHDHEWVRLWKCIINALRLSSVIPTYAKLTVIVFLRWFGSINHASCTKILSFCEFCQYFDCRTKKTSPPVRLIGWILSIRVTGQTGCFYRHQTEKVGCCSALPPAGQRFSLVYFKLFFLFSFIERRSAQKYYIWFTRCFTNFYSRYITIILLFKKRAF